MFHFSDTDQFLSEEDLDIGNLDWPERIAVWNAWLLQMQSTNEHDKDDYSHGVFLSEKQKRQLWGGNWEIELQLATKFTKNTQKGTKGK